MRLQIIERMLLITLFIVAKIQKIPLKVSRTTSTNKFGQNTPTQNLKKTTIEERKRKQY